jgi:hypothetical protein
MKEKKEFIFLFHEPLNFYFRVGTSPENVEEFYQHSLSEENIKKLSQAGVRSQRLHFYKGFGMKFEKKSFQETVEKANLLRKYKMKVSVYIGGTISKETFPVEVPEVEKWWMKDQAGNPITYGHFELHRVYPCLNSEEYFNYLKQILEFAVKEVKAEEIFFDNQVLKQEPASCHCHHCRRAFTLFLKQKYSRTEFYQRYGHPYVERIEPPFWTSVNPPGKVRIISNPALQDWVDFRCQTTANFFKKATTFIKNLNPQIAVGYNIKGIMGCNRAFDAGIDHNRLKGTMDFIVVDQGERLERREEGNIVSEIRSYKMGRSLNWGVSPGHRERTLNIIQYMVFNPHPYLKGFGYLWGIDECKIQPDPIYYPFFKKYQEKYFFKTESLKEIAIWRTYASLAYNCELPHLSTLLFEQFLIENNYLFDIIFDTNLEEIFKYQVIILANQECLTEKQIDYLLNFVQRGGGLIFTEFTGVYNGWRRERKQSLFELFFKEKFLERHNWFSTELPSLRDFPVEEKKANFGKGKVFYLREIVPKILPQIPSTSNVIYPSSYWYPPLNSANLKKALAWTTPRPFTLQVNSSPGLVIEFLKKQRKSLYLLHLINTRKDAEKRKMKNIRVKLNYLQLKEITFLSPFEKEEKRIPFKKRGNETTFTIPQLKTYGLAVLKTA